MKIILYFIGFLAIVSCSRNIEDTSELFDLEFNNKRELIHIRELTDTNSDFAIGYDFEFDGRNNLARVAYTYSDTIIGYANYYYKQQLIHCRQYILVGNEQYVNQYWNYDESGNIDRNLSNFYSIRSTGDTVSVGSPWCLTVSLDCPYFNNRMELTTGEFDDFYNLKDTLGIITTQSENFLAHQEFRFSKPGRYTKRGYIADYTSEEGVRKERRMYFKKEVVVIE